MLRISRNQNIQCRWMYNAFIFWSLTITGPGNLLSFFFFYQKETAKLYEGVCCICSSAKVHLCRRIEVKKSVRLLTHCFTQSVVAFTSLHNYACSLQEPSGFFHHSFSFPPCLGTACGKKT